jgi:predicted nucleic acid-binding protein
MLTAVLDANVIIGLAHGGVFPLLPSLYVRLSIPPPVIAEVIGQGRSGEGELQRALGVWITAITPWLETVQQFTSTLSPADRQVLAVAQGQAADHIVSAGKQLFQEASVHGLTCVQTTDVIVLLKQQGAVREVKPVLDCLRQQGFGIGDRRYEQALRAASEWPTP